MIDPRSISPEKQVEAIRNILAKIPDAALRRRIAGTMLREAQKDQDAAAEKLLGRAMAADAGPAAEQHLKYVLQLEPIVAELESQVRPRALKPGDLAHGQSQANAHPGT